MNSVVTVSGYIKVSQAYLGGNLELSLPYLMSLHHVIDCSLNRAKYISDLDKELKIYRLALKRRINYIERDIDKNQKRFLRKRRRLPQINFGELLSKMAS